MRADNISNVGARCVSLSPLGKGSALITGSYHIPGGDAARPRRVHQHHADPGLSQLRPAGSDLCDRAPDRARRPIDAASMRWSCGARISCRRKTCPTPTPSAPVYDSGTYLTNMDRTLALADWNGFAEPGTHADERGVLLGRGFANYVEILHRCAARARRDHGPAIGRDHRGDRHAAERPGPRNQLRAGGGRPARAQPVEKVKILFGDTGIRQCGRRLAFGPLHAPCRHGDADGIAAADR